MKIQATLCALAALASAASATLVIGTTTVALGGGTVAVLLGAKLLALKGLLIGRALGKRSTENLAEIFLEASRKDQYDCAKLLICELNAKPAQELMVSVPFIPFFVFGFWSLLATKLQKYKNIT